MEGDKGKMLRMEWMRRREQEMQKEDGYKKTGHLVRWNYISEAHTALILLSHQHIPQAETVYVHACENVSVG